MHCCWRVFQLAHWHRLSESCTPWHVLFWILSCATVWLRHSMSCISRTENPVQVVLAMPQVASQTCRSTSRTYWHQSHPSTMCTTCFNTWWQRVGDRSFSVATPWAWSRLRQVWSSCSRPTPSAINSKHSSFSLYMVTREQMQQWSSVWIAIQMLQLQLDRPHICSEIKQMWNKINVSIYFISEGSRICNEIK